MRLALILAAALALAVPALAQDAAKPYVAVPGDGPVWGLALDAATRDGPNFRLAFVLIDGEEPGVADLRGDFLVDCALDRYRQLELRAHDAAGNVLSVEAAARTGAPSAANSARRSAETSAKANVRPGGGTGYRSCMFWPRDCCGSGCPSVDSPRLARITPPLSPAGFLAGAFRFAHTL